MEHPEHERVDLLGHSVDGEIEMTATTSMEDDDDEDENVSLLANDDDDEDTSIWADLISSWQQHTMAIGVAILATVLAFYLQSKLFKTHPSYGRRMEADHQRRSVPQQHQHLQHYERTGNLSFCGMQASSAMDESQLKIMDFRLSSELISSMELHFFADQEKTSNTLGIFGAKQDALMTMRNTQIQCLRRMSLDSRQKLVKGMTYFYEKPSIESLYQMTEDPYRNNGAAIGRTSQLKEVYVSFTGFAAKFVNMHREAVLLFWDGRRTDDRQLVGEIPPFQSLTTATRPGESFSISPVHDHSTALERWVVTIDDAVQYYEPRQQSKLNDEEEHLLNFQKLNREFAKDYLIHSKRSWLANFPRPFPVHSMWPASWLGQRHKLDNGISLEVVSVLPRVLRIDNFLSENECQAVIDLAVVHGMTASTVYAGGTGDGATRKRQTRSSFNAWLKRNASDITDVIYRKAAPIFQLDSLAPTWIDEDLEAHEHSLVESLQVIRYKDGEQYTPHHDWVVPPIQHRFQPTRFATLLMYLNDDFGGGETNFPRAVTSNQHDGVSIAPVKGSAVLFYNVLPDGNFDDLSQHGSSPVAHGTKVR